MENFSETFESFDQSLKYLLHYRPADFIRFGLGLGDVPFAVHKPNESALPTRDREIDGAYIVEQQGRHTLAHIEFQRRHEGLEELALDIGEAQLRLARRELERRRGTQGERPRVVSLVWDLYGSPSSPVLSRPALLIGQDEHDSQVGYRLINLRGMSAAELLAQAPHTLWPLVALTRDGARPQVILDCRDAITTHQGLDKSTRADLLAVLWFVSEREHVAVRFLQDMIAEEQLMESVLYRSIFEKGEARGRAEGEARGRAETIIRILVHRLGAIEPTVRERIQSTTDMATLSAWYEHALRILNAGEAQKLADLIERPTPVQ